MSNTLCNFAEMITSKVMEKKKKKEWKDFKFHIFGTNFKVHFVERIEPSEDDERNGVIPIGRTTPDEVVYVATHSHTGEKFPDEKIAITLIHELMHCIFGTGEYQHTNADEPCVEWTARCIYSLIKQNVFKYAAE